MAFPIRRDGTLLVLTSSIPLTDLGVKVVLRRYNRTVIYEVACTVEDSETANFDPTDIPDELANGPAEMRVVLTDTDGRKAYEPDWKDVVVLTASDVHETPDGSGAWVTVADDADGTLTLSGEGVSLTFAVTGLRGQPGLGGAAISDDPDNRIEVIDGLLFVGPPETSATITSALAALEGT